MPSMRPVAWKAGAERESEKEGGLLLFNSHGHLPLPQQRKRLPVYANRSQILFAVDKFSTVVIVGETGCGKTTQIPQYLHEAGWTSGGRVVAVTQPRRIAAVSVAQRVADELGCELGDTVGHCVRFDDKSHPVKTRIKFLTDGLLLRELMLDPLLSKYSVVMVDEAHERTVASEILLALLKKIRKQRTDLKIIISSATIEAESFRDFFHSRQFPATVMTLESERLYHVDVHYLKEPCVDYVKKAVETVCSIHRHEAGGDILVFMTGREDIEATVKMIHMQSPKNSQGQTITAIPMYSALPADRQQAAFDKAPAHTRKVIVATNVAETSVTLPGIVYVIDSCFVKIMCFRPETGMDALMIVPVSQANAIQRSGRAGRVRHGKAFRLCEEDTFQQLQRSSVPEIQRASMAGVILQLKALGIKDIVHFDFLSPPPADAMLRGIELLHALGAIDNSGNLVNPVGLQMAEMPCDPMTSKMLLASKEFGCGSEAVTIAAMLNVQTVLTADKVSDPSQSAVRVFGVKEGDHLTFLNLFNAFMKNDQDMAWCGLVGVSGRAMKRAVEVRRQLVGYMKRFGIPFDTSAGPKGADSVLKCITAGFFVNAAKRYESGGYKTIRGNQIVHIHPLSILAQYSPEWIVFNEVVETDKLYARDVVAIKGHWLAEIAPHVFELPSTTAGRKRQKVTPQ